ncbi:hypothetical protein CE91St35_23840 [Eggerthella lenta]|nr:hypothetical protein CE91St34_15000 [Eggerthella lenta]GKG88230.1 hypothetical protein CE91St35_23840 [Eggerthella lenta]
MSPPCELIAPDIFPPQRSCQDIPFADGVGKTVRRAGAQACGAFEPLVPKRTLIGYPPVAPDKNWPNPCDCHIITMHCDNQSNKHAYFEDK